MRPCHVVLALAAICAAAAPVEGQILRVHFKDEKAAKKFKKQTTVVDGEVVLLGEPVPGGGILLDYKNGQLASIQFKGNANNDFFVLDSRDPSQVPYKVRDGELVFKKGNVVTVPGKSIAAVSAFMPLETIQTIAVEYRVRLDRIEELRDARGEHDKGSAEWFVEHGRLLGDYERTVSWLRNASFADAADKLAKEHAKEARTADEATSARAARALESVELTAAPEELLTVARELGGDHSFGVAQSQHVRVVYDAERLTPEEVEAALLLAERVIEGFQNQFVDPYRGDGFEDQIPEGLFQELYFGPDDRDFHERFVETWYGVAWGPDEIKEQRLESLGNRFLQGREPQLLDAWRLTGEESLDGIIAHTLGHSIADFHFNDGPHMEQDWMEEGLGYFLSFEFLGRNSVNCREFRETRYAATDKPVDREEMKGYRETLTRVALEEGERIDRVILKHLSEMESPDLAKAWSFFDFQARQAGLEGQIWMRAACLKARNRKTLIEELRPLSEELFDVTDADVYKALDDRWRAYAESELGRFDAAGD